jgi:biotin-(acetyl-CoA carboxylase) ligase
MKKTLFIISIIAIILITGSLLYYYVFFRTVNDRAQIKLEERKLELEEQKEKSDKLQEEIQKQELLNILEELEKWRNSALDQAYKDYLDQWNKECISLGLNPDSRLPTENADRINKEYDQNVEQIYEQYQIQKEDYYKFYGIK